MKTHLTHSYVCKPSNGRVAVEILQVIQLTPEFIRSWISFLPEIPLCDRVLFHYYLAGRGKITHVALHQIICSHCGKG